MIEIAHDLSECLTNVFGYWFRAFRINTLTLPRKTLLFAPPSTIVFAFGVFFMDHLVIVIVAGSSQSNSAWN